MALKIRKQIGNQLGIFGELFNGASEFVIVSWILNFFVVHKESRRSVYVFGAGLIIGFNFEFSVGGIVINFKFLYV